MKENSKTPMIFRGQVWNVNGEKAEWRDPDFPHSAKETTGHQVPFDN